VINKSYNDEEDFFLFFIFLDNIRTLKKKLDALAIFSTFGSCMDASLAIGPVFERFQSVIITSGFFF
jgi:hypothetical protein